MKPLRLYLMAAACALAGTAAPLRADEALDAKLAKKLQEPFLTKAAWLTDYEAAKAEAAKSGKMIFAYFTRSYAP